MKVVGAPPFPGNATRSVNTRLQAGEYCVKSAKCNCFCPSVRIELCLCAGLITFDKLMMAKKRLLFVVEDDVDISRLIRHHLESAGFATRVFGSMSGVVSEALKDRPSLFLLDIMI